MATMNTLTKSFLAAALASAFCLAPMQAQAGLFDDDEARKAILDLRTRIDSINSRLEGKAEKTTNLDLAGQNEQLRQEIARLRGQVEVLTNELANEQRRQKDFYTDLDNRLRKLEPQKVTVDGREVDVAVSEQKAYDEALALFKDGNYKGAATGFAGFVKRYPQSGFAAAAHYWLGTSYYAQRDYRGAINALQTVVRSFPENPKAPDALLNISSCYTELKDKVAARKALESLIGQYPNSAAAGTAKERLASLK
jgi:tol-pal system protein YbgF